MQYVTLVLFVLRDSRRPDSETPFHVRTHTTKQQHANRLSFNFICILHYRVRYDVFCVFAVLKELRFGFNYHFAIKLWGRAIVSSILPADGMRRDSGSDYGPQV